MAAPLEQPVLDAFELYPDPVALLAADGTLLRANGVFRSAFRHWIGPGRPPWGRVQAPEFERGQRRFDAPAPDGRVFEWIEQKLPDGVRLVAARDVTRYARAAEEALRAKTVLFATLTHELRTPLNGILGMAGLLANASLEPSAQSYLAAIRQSGELLLDLITEILDYSRLEAGRVALEHAPFDPEAAMQSVAEVLSPKARDKGLELAVVVRAGVPLMVSGDDGRLRQILFNLAGNAVKFTGQGGVVIECASTGRGRLRFTVRDSGPGVAPEKQALIFEEFSQADAGVAHKHGGAGLGLAIVKKLAHAMGGEAGLHSKPGQGASFWVDLPLAPAEGGAPARSLGGVRVAIVSTSAILARALEINIVSLGGAVVAREAGADVILVDWGAGFGAAEAAEFGAGARAVIALAPQEEREAIAKIRAAGVEHYTLKPVRRRSLAERIRVALGAAPTPAVPFADEQAPTLDLGGLRALLAEDNPVNALLARTLLSRAGCVVDVVGDGEEALAAAAAAPYDLIFLDLRMPRLDGVEAARRIRALPGPAGSTPIIALTADAAEDERARALGAGMDDFITKPIEPARLAAVAARFTGGRKPASVASPQVRPV